jgi:hypothetical protein
VKKILENPTKLYGIIGKVLCALAGGIVGFIYGGIFLALPGILVGALAGYYLERGVVNHALK